MGDLEQLRIFFGHGESREIIRIDRYRQHGPVP